MNKVKLIIILLLIILLFVSGCITDDVNNPDSNPGNSPSNVKTTPNPENLRQLSLKINGMTCAGCAFGVQYSLKQLDGVVDAEINYLEGTGELIYDAGKISKERIVNDEAFSIYPAEVVEDNPFTGSVASDEETAMKAVHEDVHEFNITAFQWGFEPSIIEVHKDAVVILSLRSRDVTHGFALPEFEILGRIEPGKTTTLLFIADREGEFTYYCSIPCGSGHSQMKGKFIVE